MKRRAFIKVIAGSAVTWPLAAYAQQPDNVRRVGALINLAANDPESPVQIAVFLGGLQERGWTIGRNLRIDYRWGAGDAKLYRKYADELVALKPDVILAVGGTIVGAIQQASRTVPIVFVQTTDPVSRGLVASLARPGGNATGFVQYEFNMAGKYMELLKQIAPRVTRVAVIRDPIQFSGVGQLAGIQTVAPSFGVELIPVDPRDASEIERSITAFARGSNGGLIVTASGAADGHRDLIVTLAARHGLPAVYPYRRYVTGGGLISYGPDLEDEYRLAAGYVDRILKGENPADLPVQAPTKYQLVINLKAAKALGLAVPPEMLARADEVIE
jgi:putative tryptophan/tyrosine transport system substrate-binding protein